MTKILFVCHGNICRSPMAEFVMRDMVEKAGLSDRFLIESAATSAEELGNPVYPPVRRLLAQHGIDCTGKRARRLERADLERFDLLIGMDEGNLRDMRRILLASETARNAVVPHGRHGYDPDSGSPCGAQKLCLLLDFTDHPRSVADPWYTRDFEATWRDVNDGCRGLLQKLMND